MSIPAIWNGFPAGGKGLLPKCLMLPGQKMLVRRRISAGLSRKWSAIIRVLISVVSCTVNVGVFQDSRFFVIKNRKERNT